MRKTATMLFALLLVALLADRASAQGCTSETAQDVTVSEINFVEQSAIDALNASGASVTSNQIAETVPNDLRGQCVRFTAVILTDPLNSGLATAPPTPEGTIARIHVYVRDTTAATAGPAGMDVQVVDGSFEDTGLIDATIGDVITVIGTVDIFTGSGGVSLQVSPVALTLIGSYQDFNLSDDILEPVVITTADANKAMGDGQVQVNWDNLGRMNGQFVRLENATVLVRADITGDRPNWLVTTDGGETVMNFYDTSIRYRNDRSTYPNKFNKRPSNSRFVPPPAGTKINLTGTIVFQGDDPFVRGVPPGAILSIVPWEDADLEILEQVPEASLATKPATVPVPGEDVTVSTDVTVDLARTVSSVTLTYWTSADATEHQIAMTNTGGDTYSATIPGQAEGVFVIYNVTAEDNTGAEFVSNNQDYRIFADVITSIQQLQEHSGGTGGAGPFATMTIPLNITATVQSRPAASGEISIQDDADLDPWTGIMVNPTAALIADLVQGDVINITNAQVREAFGVTQLNNLTYTKVGSGAGLGYKVITTGALRDLDVAEAHEGMTVRFEDVIVTSINPDAPAGPFGEWELSSDGDVANQIRVDDQSDAIGSGFAASLNVWEKYSFQQGIWWFSFGNYKLVAETIEDDIGVVTNVGIDDGELPEGFALGQNYPNPFNPVTTIEYGVPASGIVTLEVLDMLGRQVAVLVNTEMAPGSYTVKLDGEGLASGIYVYRLTAGSHSTTRKMLLMK